MEWGIKNLCFPSLSGMEEPLLQLPLLKQPQEQQQTGGFEITFAQLVGAGQSHSWCNFTGTKWTPFRVICISKYKEMIPCHCTTNPAPTAAKTWNLFSVMQNLDFLKISSNLCNIVSNMDRRKMPVYSPLLTKAFPGELAQAGNGISV